MREPAFVWAFLWAMFSPYAPWLSTLFAIELGHRTRRLTENAKYIFALVNYNNLGVVLNEYRANRMKITEVFRK